MNTVAKGCWMLVTWFGLSWSNASALGDENDGDQTCEVVAWVPYWDQKAAMASFEEHAELIDYMSVFWYHLAPDGSIRKYRHAHEDRAVIDTAHEQGVKVLALVANLADDQVEGNSDEEWDATRVKKVIGSAARREAHIASLLKLVKRMDFDGINIDYEALPAELRKDFTRFIEELGEALHDRDKLLAVALHPKTGEGIPAEDNGSHAQDWEELPKHADQLHLMTYGEHNSGTTPGPIASPRWLKPILEYAREGKEIPADKLFVGVPLYADAWEPLGAGRYRPATAMLTYMDVKRAEKEYGVRAKWNEKSGSPSLAFQSHRGKKRIVWFEDSRSVARKFAVAREFGICNFGLWRLGGEDPAAWESLRKSLGRKGE